jgi:hypothetical protein
MTLFGSIQGLKRALTGLIPSRSIFRFLFKQKEIINFRD